MTAEIIILNGEAIALAADSAVTIGMGRSEKIYNSANKLFTLSKFQPVGIMVYGSATFMNIPWETIIKSFREQLHSKCYDKLEQYAKRFIQFMEKNEIGISKEHQLLHLGFTASAYFNYMYDDIQKELDILLKKEEKIKLSESKKAVTQVINRHYKHLRKRKYLQRYTKKFKDSLKKKIEKEIEKSRKHVFEKLQLSKQNIKQLNEIICFIFTKDIFPEQISGLVITGFGDKEIFPSFSSYKVECIILNKLKYKLLESGKITETKNGIVKPFAQFEMVNTFMEGIDPRLYDAIIRGVEKNYFEFSKLFLHKLESKKKISDKERTRIEKELIQISKELSKNFNKQIHSTFIEKHISSIMNAVSVLPKNELANLAEALVNLTSLKRKFTSDQKETVGGPIDVAIISKGDGFVWIKRKHYFKPELNPYFMNKYFIKAKKEGAM